MKKFILAAIIVLLPVMAFAGTLPFITEEAGTSGYKHGQMDAQWGYVNEDNFSGNTVTAGVRYGISDNIDMIVTIPWLSLNSGPTGFGDAGLALKWKFYSKDAFSFALMPAVTFPSGSDNKGFGNGEMTGGLTAIGTYTNNKLAISSNIAYVRNENTRDFREDVYKASLVASYEIYKNLIFGVDAGIATNPYKYEEDDSLAYILPGLNYKFGKGFEGSFGVKFGLSDSTPDATYLTGITYRF